MVGMGFVILGAILLLVLARAVKVAGALICDR